MYLCPAYNLVGILLFDKNIVFTAQAEYYYFSADLGCYSKNVLNVDFTGTTLTIDELPFASAVSKQVYVRSYSCENQFPLQVYFHANQTILYEVLQEDSFRNRGTR